VYGDATVYGYKAKYVVALDWVAATAKFVLYVVDCLVNNQSVTTLWRRLFTLLSET
jgi:hypothetical protein